jgi:hypothetical protein
VLNLKTDKISDAKPQDRIGLTQSILSIALLIVCFCQLSIGFYQLSRASAEILVEMGSKNYIDNSD